MSEETEIIERIDTAIKLLRDGYPLKVADLTFGINAKENVFFVSGASYSTDLSNITRNSALEELVSIEALFKKMVSISFSLQEFIKGKTICFQLIWDYGMGGIGVCSEQNGNVKWLVEHLK